MYFRTSAAPLRRLLLVATVAAPYFSLPAQTMLTAQQRKDIDEFREHQTALLKGEGSALGMVALNRLPLGDTTVGSAPDNTIRLLHAAAHLCILREGGGQLMLLPNGRFPVELQMDGGAPQAGPIRFDPEGTSPKFKDGSVNFVLRHKFGFYLVGRDTRSPELLAFHGLKWFEPEAKYRVSARWIPYPQPQILRVANILGQVNEETTYGIAEFTWQGQTIRLEPTTRSDSKYPLFLVFRDATSTTTTYQAGRFLDIEMPDHGLSEPGNVVLDFNRARNPLCAFSAHTSCPLPPAENRMKIAMPAGEGAIPRGRRISKGEGLQPR